MQKQEEIPNNHTTSDSLNESNTRNDSNTFNFAKVIVIGDTTVGKSALIYRLLHKKFALNTNLTCGVDFNTYNIQLDKNDEMKLQIWDTAGQDKYRSLVAQYFRNSQGALLVCDLTNIKTLEAIAELWLKLLHDSAPENICKVIAANKCDLIQNIEDKTLCEFEKKLNIKVIKTSAKTGEGIEEAIFYLANEMKIIFQLETKINIENENKFEINKFELKKKIKIRCDGKKEDNSDISENKKCCL